MKAKQAVRMMRVGEKPAPNELNQQWEYLTLTGGQQHLMNIQGEQGWEAFGVTQVPGQMVVWMKRRKQA